MNERSINQAALPPVPRWNRRRRIIAIVAGIAVVGAAGYLGLQYFTRCGNCGQSPILCPDPCTLPKFGQIDNRPVSVNGGVTASAPAQPQHRVS